MSKLRRSTASEVQKLNQRAAAPSPTRKSPVARSKAAGTSGKAVVVAAKADNVPSHVPVAKVKAAPGAVAILAIGDEVLRGEIENSNAAFLADRLFDAGYEVRVHRVVSDAPEDIRAALEDLAAQVSVIVATGGLGPTDDDRTVDVVCDLLGVKTTDHVASLDAMKQRFSAHGFALTPNNMRQVRVPEGAVAFPNSAGIAPGFCVRIGEAEAYFLPGIPREMESIFVTHCMPRLVARMSAHGVPKAAVRTFHVYGMGESHIDHRLVGLEAIH